MRKTVKWTALLLALMMLAGCAQKAEREAPELLEPVGVQSNAAICAAYIDDIYEIAAYDASVKPYVEALSFKVSGEVMSINAYPGMTVEEGDALIELDQVSLQARAEQLQEELNYTQQDGKYTDEIAALEIEILETELRQLSETQITLKEKEATLKEKAAALQEKANALQESTTVPEESETAPEEGEITPEESETTLGESESTPEESETAPEEDETTSVEEELAQVKTEIALVENEIVLAEEEIARVEKEIALKENEIAQKQTLLRQGKEQRALDRTTKQKELNELNVSLEENVLRAPFTGRIVYGDMLKPGSWVQAEDPVVFLSDDNKLSIECAYIPESTIESADRVYAHIGAKEYELKYVPIDPDELLKLTILGEKLTSTFEIIASEKELREIEAGQYAAIFLWSNYESNALVIPSSAVMHDSVGRYDYVYVDENGTRVKRTVKIGTVAISRVQIVEGLEEGDVVYVQN